MGLKLGKLAPKHSPKTLSFAKYVSEDTPPPPVEKVYYEYLVETWPMYGNNELGDCVFACAGHMLQNWSAHGGKEIRATNEDILAVYEAVGGYKPGDPSTDNGAVITEFLTWWQKHPIAGKTISGWASVNPKDLDQVKQAIYVFGGIDIGIQVPQSAMDQFQAGENWEVSDDPTIIGGHSICVFGYGAQGCACITWGKIQYMSWEFFQTYCDEAYAIVSPDFIESATKKTEFGLDLAALERDLKEIAA